MSEPLRIFLSYRREDASGHAGRLYDALAARFGAENVFMDIDTIDLGADFAHVITEAVASCDVLIALIGRQWLSERLENPDDFVRLEVEAALNRDVFVIPALVQGAVAPSSEQLPEGLASLARRQGTELRDVGWRDDVSRLVERLERLARQKAGRAEAPAAPPRRSRRTLIASALAGMVLAAGAVGAFILFGGDSGSAERDAQRPTSTTGKGRLLGLIAPVTRSSCNPIDYGADSAETSLECSGVRASVTYNLFESNDVMGQWYSQERELAAIEPLSGACTPSRFQGEVHYVVGEETVGSYFCHLVDRSPELVWMDERASVGAKASVYEGTGRPAVESLLRQWKCCLQLEAP